MALKTSSRIQTLTGYAFAEVDRLVDGLRRDGVAVLDFGVGDPTTPTPELIRRAGQTAIEQHASSGYPSYVGSLRFRQACADWVGRRFGVEVTAEEHVSSTVGSKEACFHLPLAFADQGDVVVSPNPGYPPYARGAAFAGAESWTYPLLPEHGFLPDLDAIPDDVLSRTRVLWVNYPNSPTGTVAPLSFYEEAAALCREHDMLLASDEAYCDIWFGDEPPAGALQAGLENVLAVFSMSKRSAMTGWRSGYVVGDPAAVAAFRKLKTNIDSGTPDFVQDASIAALADEVHPAEMREEYRRKRDVLADAFEGLGLPASRPESTLYLWQRVPEGQTSVEFAKRLLDPEVAIVVTPGTWLSSATEDGTDPGEGFVRLALVPTLAECEDAARRLARLGSAT